MASRALSVLGTVVLLHAGYSANQYKTLLYAQGQGESGGLPPLDVMIECVVSFGLILLGQLLATSFEFTLTSPQKKFAAFNDRFGAPEFSRFNNRAAAMRKRQLSASGKSKTGK
jgi:hypothetical protein